jgi:hypothetical protein
MPKVAQQPQPHINDFAEVLARVDARLRARIPTAPAPPVPPAAPDPPPAALLEPAPEGDAVRDGGSSPEMPISECVAEPRESWRLPHQPTQGRTDR